MQEYIHKWHAYTWNVIGCDKNNIYENPPLQGGRGGRGLTGGLGSFLPNWRASEWFHVGILCIFASAHLRTLQHADVVWPCACSRKHDWGWGEEGGETDFTHCAVTCDVFDVWCLMRTHRTCVVCELIIWELFHRHTKMSKISCTFCYFLRIHR